MGINSTEVSYGFGQLGSTYQDAAAGVQIVPPTNKVWIAITMLEDTTFDAIGGLSAQRINLSGTDNDIYIGTDQPSHDLDSGSETVHEGSGGKVVDGITFPKGITIYGRWTNIQVATGGVIAYVGD